MRIPQESARAKAAAKRLTALSNLGVIGVKPLSLSRAYDVVARMHGYRDWHELSRARDKLAVPDHSVPASERRERRAQQASALEAVGFAPEAAAAMVEAVLPSGDFEVEMVAATSFAEGHIRRLSRLPSGEALEAAWIMANLAYGPERAGWATKVAARRHALDGGLAKAAARARERIRERTGPGEGGYFGVIAENRDFFQGYFLADPGPQVLEACDAIVRQANEEADPVEALLRGFEGMAESGYTAVPFTRMGSLQTGLLITALKQPPDMLAVAGFGWLIAQQSGLRYFVVKLERETSSGIQTSLEKINAGNVDEARAAIMALPEVGRIKEGLRRKLGIPPGIG